MIKRRKLIFFLGLVIIIVLTGCIKNTDILEIARVQFLANQSSELDIVSNQTGWQNIELPAMFQPPYPRAHRIQHVWFRAEFNSLHPEKYHGITLGRVYFNDRTYINGQLVGKHETTPISDLHYPRYYEIPEKLLHPGLNTIYIYLGMYGVEYGGLANTIRLMPRDSFIKNSIFDYFLFRQLTVGILVLFIGQIIFSLILLLWMNKDPINLISLIIFLVWISYLLAIYSPYYPFSIDFRISYLWACTSAAAIFFFAFIQYYYRVFLPRYNLFYYSVHILIIILILINQDTTSPFFMGRILGLIGVVITLFSNGFLIGYIYKVKPNKIIIYFIIFGFIPALAIVWDIISYLFISHVPPLYHIYTLPVMVILFMILRIRDTVLKEVQMDMLYDKLKEKIGPSTGKDEKDGLTLTPAMKQKLQKVIEFLKENYQSDISREGLAKTMDLSPDHMSRMFKAYTGKKLNEFINELRIHQVEKLLIESDDKIIDVAFFVGFESLVTFNRSFLKITGMTPSIYRKQKNDNISEN